MFIAFSVPAFLFWAFIAAFLPGAVISFSIFRKDELNALEKLLTGFAIGMVSLPLIPFLLYLVLGIKFSYALALLSVAALYAIAIALFVKNKMYEGVKLPEGGISIKLPSGVDGLVNALLSIKAPMLIGAGLIIVLVLTYLVRIGSYSPIYQELDPYYYTYVAHQILSVGYNPLNDSTAWYPDVVADHREIPEISYLESIWYSFYTGGAAYNGDNMHLALIASMYPPIAAVLAVFFIYLLVSASSKREWGVMAAGIASFVPVFVYKLAAGEQEVQPYAFFALFFFYAMYALAMSRKDLRFTILAGLAFAAVGLGSSSQLLALSAVLIFMAGQAVLHFLRDSDGSELRQLLTGNAIVFVIGPLIGGILKGIFANGTVDFQIMGPYLLVMVFVAVLYALKQKLPERSSAFMALAAFLVVGVVLFTSTPLGDMVKHVAKAGFEVAQYNSPLDRTIAEQGGASTVFDSQLGSIAAVFSQPGGTGQNMFSQLFGNILWLVFLPFTAAVNAILSISVSFLNFLVNTNVSFSPLTNSIMLFWIFAFTVSLAYGLWKFSKKEDDALFILFLAVVMPPLIVGIIKAKYTIYAGVMLAVAIGFTLEPLSKFLAWVGERLSKEEDRELLAKQAYYSVLIIGAILVIMQFTYGNFSSSLGLSSLQPLYQNDPSALASKFKAFCSTSNDSVICAAAADPLGYAAKGTNNQYSYELCLASIYSSFDYLSNPGAAPSWEPQAAYFRCQRISDYWINAMEWLRYNTPEGSRIVSWWDYGHWINYFGLRNAVIRNEHLSHEMIGEVAHDYVDGTPQDLIDYMKSHDIKYALFDMELVSGGGQLGGKYGALNYLSCARDNETDVSKSPGASQCEAEHLWETVYVASQPCIISSISNKTGLIAYEMYQDIYVADANGKVNFMGTFYTPAYPPDCVNPTDANVISYCKNNVKAVPTYCVGQVTLANGQQTYGTYYLNETYPNGDLKLNKALLEMPAQIQNSTHFGPATAVTLLYTNDSIWLENGEVKSGYEDRKGLFYSSNIYSALFLNEIPGFKLVYSTPDNAVKIYELGG